MTQIQRGGSTLDKAQYSYDDNDGRVTKITYGNNARSEYAHDDSGALTKISHFSGGGTIFASVAYEHDLAGNVTKATLDDSLTYPGDAVVTYTYDDLHRLVREECTPGQGSYRQAYRYCYTYDAVGNRTERKYWNGSTTETMTMDYSPRNELTKMTSGGNETSLSYDLRGNLTKKGRRSIIGRRMTSSRKCTTVRRQLSTSMICSAGG